MKDNVAHLQQIHLKKSTDFKKKEMSSCGGITSPPEGQN